MRRDRPDSPLIGGDRRRSQQRRRWLLALPVAALAIAALLTVGPQRTGDDMRDAQLAISFAEIAEADVTPAAPRGKRGSNPAPAPVAKRFRLERASESLPVRRDFKHAPRAGILFDVDSGEVLWERHPRRELPIASLTKMMTALLIAGEHRPTERVRISQRAVRTTGSKVGLLPKGKRVELEPLLYGLLLVSGNDTAVALAEHDSGQVASFVKKMNREARRRGLDCSQFSSPHGLADRGNFSCPRDLAAMARAILADRRLAKMVASPTASFDFPIKGGRLDLYNNNPLMRLGRPGITGVKTGLTDAAGRCYVTTARRRGRHLGVVLLHSPDPITQIDKLLDEGFGLERKD